MKVLKLPELVRSLSSRHPLCVILSLLCQTVILGRLLAPCPSAPRVEREATRLLDGFSPKRTRCLATGRRRIVKTKGDH